MKEEDWMKMKGKIGVNAGSCSVSEASTLQRHFPLKYRHVISMFF
jgi:hypothetical protein